MSPIKVSSVRRAATRLPAATSERATPRRAQGTVLASMMAS